MATVRLGQSVDYKTGPSLGGWLKGGSVTAFVGKLIEVTDGRGLVHPCKPSHVRPAREETKPDRGAQQAAARAATRAMMDAEHQRQAEAEGYTFGEPAQVIAADVKPSLLGITARAAIRPQPKAPKPTRSEAYKKWVRMQDCAITGRPANEAHHYTSETISRGVSEKVSDYYCVPLTSEAHAEWHRRGACEGVFAKDSRQRLATKVAMLEGALRSLVGFLEQTKEGGEDE